MSATDMIYKIIDEKCLKQSAVARAAGYDPKKFNALLRGRKRLTSDDVVLLHDDLLATGGTAVAALNLIRRFSPKAIYANFIIELSECDGMAAMPSDIETTALLKL